MHSPGMLASRALIFSRPQVWNARSWRSSFVGCAAHGTAALNADAPCRSRASPWSRLGEQRFCAPSNIKPPARRSRLRPPGRPRAAGPVSALDDRRPASRQLTSRKRACTLLRCRVAFKLDGRSGRSNRQAGRWQVLTQVTLDNDPFPGPSMSTFAMTRGASREHQRAFDAEAQVLAHTLRARRLTVLVGTRGIGKTPLLVAGVLPLLSRRAGDEPRQPGATPHRAEPVPDRRGRVPGPRPRRIDALRRPVERGAGGGGVRSDLAEGHVARAPGSRQPTARRGAPAVRVRPLRAAGRRRAARPRPAAVRRRVGRGGAGARPSTSTSSSPSLSVPGPGCGRCWGQSSGVRAAGLPPADTVRSPGAGTPDR